MITPWTTTIEGVKKRTGWAGFLRVRPPSAITTWTERTCRRRRQDRLDCVTHIEHETIMNPTVTLEA